MNQFPGLEAYEANEIIAARDKWVPNPESPDHELPILRMDTTDAAAEVEAFDDVMVDWDYTQVLRFINGIDSAQFEKVKDKCKEIDFDGKPALTPSSIYILFRSFLSFHFSFALLSFSSFDAPPNRPPRTQYVFYVRAGKALTDGALTNETLAAKLSLKPSFAKKILTKRNEEVIRRGAGTAAAAKPVDAGDGGGSPATLAGGGDTPVAPTADPALMQVAFMAQSIAASYLPGAGKGASGSGDGGGDDVQSMSDVFGAGAFSSQIGVRFQ